MKLNRWSAGPIALLTGAVLAVTAVPWSSAAAPPGVWIQNAADRAYISSTPPPRPTTSISLHSARNEYEATQVLVRSSQAQSGVNVTTTALTGPGGATIPASAITIRPLYNHTNVYLNRSDESDPDQEFPPGGGSNYTDWILPAGAVNVPANTTQAFWFTVYAAANQTPGVYNGTATVVSSLGNVSVPVRVQVYNVTLPPTNQSTFKMNNWFGSAGWDYGSTELSLTAQYPSTAQQPALEIFNDRWWELMENVAANHQRHRNNVIFADFQALLIPDTTYQNGNFDFGWETFDRFIQLFIDAGALQYIATPHLLESIDGQVAAPRELEVLQSDGNGGVERVRVAPFTASAEAYLDTVFAALKTHLEAKGWDEIFYMAASDEPFNTGHLVESRWMYEIYAQHFTGTSYKTIEAHNHTLEHTPEYAALEPYLTSKVPTPDLYEARTAAYQQDLLQGKELWLYTAAGPRGHYMNRFMDYHLAKTRLLPWLVWKDGGVGYLHWGWNNWTTRDTSSGNYWLPGDSWLVRPDPNNNDVFDSIRSEAQRDGIEDFELLAQLNAIKPTTADAIVNSLVVDSEVYTRSGAQVVDGHRELLQAIVSAQTDANGSRRTFVDDFSTGDARYWVAGHRMGSWTVVSNEYRQTDVNATAVSPVFARAYRDFVLTIDLKIDAVSPNGGSTNWAGVVIRNRNGTDLDSGYLVGIRNNGVIFAYESGVEIAAGSVPGYVAGAWTNLKVAVIGDQLRVFANHNPTAVLTVTDSTFTSGHVAVATSGTSSRFDNVRVNPGLNLAEARPVTSTNNQNNWGWTTYALTDGRASSTPVSMGFSTTAVAEMSTQNVTIDLGSQKSVSLVDIMPRTDGANAGYGFPVDFTIKTSTDGSTWVTKVTRAGYANPGAALQSFAFTPVNARYVRVEATKLSKEGPSATTYRLQLAEVEVYGGNLATGRAVSASSSFTGDSWSPGNVTDGFQLSVPGNSMGWTSGDVNLGVQHTEHVQVDLGRQAIVGKVELTPRNDELLGAFYPQSFVIQTSTDGTTWVTQRTEAGVARPTSGDPIPYSFTPVTSVRYVRILSTNGLRPEGGEYRMQFAEIGVFPS